MRFLFFCLLSTLPLCASPHTGQILYLIQGREVSRALELYEEHRASLGAHDTELLEQMALTLLEQGAQSGDPEKQLLSIYGSSIAGLSSRLAILEAGIASNDPQTQLASIQYLGRLQDDRSGVLLNRAMSSDFFAIRMHAAWHLAERREKTAIGQIEGLMYRLPPEYRYFFPEFFALIGTAEGVGVLKHLMDDDVLETRLQAVLSASRYGRDDLLPGIRARSTHLNSAEQEACARALGELRDSSSIPRLKRLAQASAPALRLAALQSLFALGDAAAAEPIRQMAQQQQPFAIALLGALPGSEEALLPLLRTEALQVRLNAALSLLRLRDARCLPTLYEVLLRDGRDLGFQPHFSPGGSLMAWKAIPSFAQHADHEDLAAASLGMREQTLRFCIELPELAFLEIAETLFLSKQGELIPQVIALLENKRSPASIRLLKRYAQRAGAPLVRAYCNLALYRLGEQGPYRDAVKAWILQNKQAEMIRFRPMLPWHFRALEGAFSLTPEESSRLLIDSYMALAERHEVENIDLLLQAIKEGNRKNRYVLAGLLIRALE